MVLISLCQPGLSISDYQAEWARHSWLCSASGCTEENWKEQQKEEEGREKQNERKRGRNAESRETEKERYRPVFSAMVPQDCAISFQTHPLVSAQFLGTRGKQGDMGADTSRTRLTDGSVSESEANCDEPPDRQQCCKKIRNIGSRRTGGEYLPLDAHQSQSHAPPQCTLGAC